MVRVFHRPELAFRQGAARIRISRDLHVLALNHELLEALEVRIALMVQPNQRLLLTLFKLFFAIVLLELLLFQSFFAALFIVIFRQLTRRFLRSQLHTCSLDRNIIQERVSDVDTGGCLPIRIAL